MLKRMITAVVLTVVTVGFFLLRKIDTRLFDIYIYFYALVGTFEITRAVGNKITKSERIMCLLYTFIVVPLFVFVEIKVAVIIAVLLLWAVLTISMFLSKCSFEAVGSILLSLVYPTIPLLLMSRINDTFSIEDSLFSLILIFIAGSMTDGCAYLVGSALKGKKLCPSISPNKTISGAVGGLLGGVIGCIATYFFTKFLGKEVLTYFDGAMLYIVLVVLGIVVSIVDQIGDLFESLIKRKTGIKDMGKIFPGHGGVMDRIDGLSFVTVVTFVFMYFVGFIK